MVINQNSETSKPDKLSGGVTSWPSVTEAKLEGLRSLHSCKMGYMLAPTVRSAPAKHTHRTQVLLDKTEFIHGGGAHERLERLVERHARERGLRNACAVVRVSGRDMGPELINLRRGMERGGLMGRGSEVPLCD